MARKASKTVGDIMVTEVVILRPEDSLEDVVTRFIEKKISSAPVINENNEVVGIVSEYDLLKSLKDKSVRMSMVYPSVHSLGVAFQRDLDFGEIVKAFEKLRVIQVKEVMNAEVTTLNPKDSVKKAGATLLEKKVTHIPIVKNRKLVGIVAREDIIRGLVD